MENSKGKIEESKEYFKRGYKSQLNGNYVDAIRNYKISISLFPTVETFTFLGLAYSYLGNFDKAIDECKNAIELEPENGNPYNDIGAYMIKQGKYEEAIPFLELAINSKKIDNVEYAHTNMGLSYERQGFWFEALEEYKIAIEINPDYKTALECYNRVQGLLN
jgi:tetratricopeptide (TPR) repeat protein